VGTPVLSSSATPEVKVASSLGHFLISSKVKAELEQIPRNVLVITEGGRDQVARRAARLEPIIKGAGVLLVNDFPEQMGNVINILRGLAVEVHVATNSEQAMSILGHTQFDVVVSDMSRGQTPDEGIRFLNNIRHRGVHLHTIFTVGRYEPERGTPAHAFGITNRVDELLNLIFDVFERTRG
jgi:CheY-like chemotaxis protein